MNDRVIELAEGYVTYGSTRVLKVTRFFVGQGEIVLVRGGNGTGKTSLFQAIVGIGPTFSGHFLFPIA